ncbi:hypothetical protein DAPPUDRAFT_42690 [Daphnia pulex]|uniref:Transporter n=1 Tax=Daphnia pulex TaxID=6669 RepID=E9FWH3_DAPPU|nr:hypothetical protein DAPPUDRAFT_42690 [Daphnia pulex]|eukprot:EFX87893.1 hypothetical protein DAPPUDRAFT_42690 [Daphnia pulex]
MVDSQRNALDPVIVCQRDENIERGNWSNKLEFILSCFSYAVGLGTIWRFPYLCYRNGGGAFLIPYAIMYVFAGLPLFFFELSFGQYASEGPVSIWKVAPIFQGIGYAMFLISFFIGIYYNMVVAWSFRYLFASMAAVLPWTSCDNVWNTKIDSDRNCHIKSETNASFWNQLELMKNASRLPADEYFHHRVLHISTGIHDLGPINWELALCLLLAWACVFMVLLRGIKTFGKAVYFTALFPYLILTILLIRSATLPGFMDGIMFYLTPQWDKLTEASVWGDAAMQIFFSLSPCWGGLITLASYNRFHNNCFRDAIIVATGNVLTAFFAGFVIFGIIGFMAFELGTTVDKVATQGTGLAFAVYPEAVARLPIAPLWSILFFVMLLTLGLGTQFTVLETVVTTIVDLFSRNSRFYFDRWVLLACATIMFLLGLVMCTDGGMYVLQLIDTYAATFSALIIGMTEVCVIAWHYGVDRFLDDIRNMLGHDAPPRWYWRFVWKFFTPIIIVAILIFTLVDFKTLTYGDYTYPMEATILGFFIALSSVSMVPIVATYKILQLDGPIGERVRILLQPTSDWGPALQVHRIECGAPTHTDSQVPLTLPNCKCTSPLQNFNCHLLLS